jgi:hypothetical protein
MRPCGNYLGSRKPKTLITRISFKIIKQIMARSTAKFANWNIITFWLRCELGIVITLYFKRVKSKDFVCMSVRLYLLELHWIFKFQGSFVAI